ncbi:hypothetical protein [Streptomyces zhihengii]|uniref:Integral membrane protein n=1 Tax=Streptomyces zhihengii TaxID=1818004 RepID=A0ABS2UY47_9ACTN|nr:hypothetical protein [Streptomyces zhihengii]MBM9621822.1 hypothetical protein [Streptomyces zhihengii]
MANRLPHRTPERLPEAVATLILALTSAALWAAWLGWDQHRDVHPDGSTTGPYGAWQVIGLVLTLLAPLYWAAARRHVTGAVLGITAGLTAAAYLDWSDDASGLYMIGVIMVALGSAAATALTTLAIASLRRPAPAARPV